MGFLPPLCFWWLVCQARWLVCQARWLSLPSGENKAEYTELVPHMTQATLKMAENMATRVTVWSDEALRTHSKYT